jgi:hypothetical protein
MIDKDLEGESHGHISRFQGLKKRQEKNEKNLRITGRPSVF